MRGRHKDAVPRERKDLRIRADIMAQVDLLLLDPSRQKVDYGRWSELVEELLLAWLARQTSGAREVNRTKVQIALQQLQGRTPDLAAVTVLLLEALGVANNAAPWPLGERAGQIDDLTTGTAHGTISESGVFTGANDA